MVLTDREEEAIIPRESKTLHCPSMVRDGMTTSATLNVPNADEALATIATPSC